MPRSNVEIAASLVIAVPIADHPWPVHIEIPGLNPDKVVGESWGESSYGTGGHPDGIQYGAPYSVHAVSNAKDTYHT
jgi:hypothetical protein